MLRSQDAASQVVVSLIKLLLSLLHNHITSHYDTLTDTLAGATIYATIDTFVFVISYDGQTVNWACLFGTNIGYITNFSRIVCHV